jgi:AAA15 family ATPase/GTPase
MLEKVRFKNFKSFTKETVISLIPTKSEILKETNIFDDTLKGCAFYGGNASGKTNALNSITLLLDLLCTNSSFDAGQFVSLFTKEKSMWFEFTFKESKDRITYFFEVDREGKILKEKLNLNDKEILDRILDSAETVLTEKRKYGNGEVDSKSLFLKSVIFNASFSEYPSLSNWVKFLKNSIYLNPSRQFGMIIPFNSNRHDLSLMEYLDNQGETGINDFFKEFNFPYYISYEKKDNSNPVLVPFDRRLKVSRKDLASIPFYMESFGNQTLLSILPSFLSVAKTGGILAIDEFSSGLHNKLEELLIHFFYENSKNSQLLFVSHSTNLLKTNLLRPDQVYSVDLDKNGSVLHRFSDENPRESQNLEKMYLSGVFGGIPLYDEVKNQ